MKIKKHSHETRYSITNSRVISVHCMIDQKLRVSFLLERASVAIEAAHKKTAENCFL